MKTKAEYEKTWREKNPDYWVKRYLTSKDGFFSLYYLPEEHYIGITDCVKRRIDHHSANGKITEGYEVIAKFERSVDAHLLETMFHMRGYNGYNDGRRKINIKLNHEKI